MQHNDKGVTNAIPEMTARELVMALFDSAREPVLSVAYLVAAAALFDIDARALRVALTRLVKAGVLISPRRGEYTVGAAGEALHARVRHWERVEDDVVPWSGSWWMVDVAALGRADRAALRRRERALRLRGFSGDTTGTWWRPANLNRDVGTLHEELVSLTRDCCTSPRWRPPTVCARMRCGTGRRWRRAT